MKKAIFFDLDGTLIDSAPDLADALNHTLAQLGYPTYPLDKIRTWIGGGASMLVRRALSGSKEPKQIDGALFEKALAIFMEYYSRHLTDKTLLYPYAKEVLKALSKRYKLALITNKPSRFASSILEHFALGPFVLTLGGDTLPHKKPSPLPLLYACEQLHIKPQEALMVGDSLSDYEAAREAKIPIMLAQYGYDSAIHSLDAPKITNLKVLLEYL